nr:DUF2752 domain-containing protein [Mucilaginibacter oryzae]
MVRILKTGLVLAPVITNDLLIIILLNKLTAINAFCSYLNIVRWLQNHLITCPFKKLTGIDCPGCGMQRAVIALLKGEIYNSFKYYPACIAVLVTALFVILSKRYRFNKTQILKKAFYSITLSIIIVSYVIKLYKLFNY